MTVRISNDDIAAALGAPSISFPKYVAPLLNLANNYAHGTRPRVVGQMSELIEVFDGDTVVEWEEWYVREQPEAISKAVKRIEAKVDELRDALTQVDRDMIEKWVRDLVIFKTYQGMRFQKAILQKIAASVDKAYRRASPEEEAKGIDGFVGGHPVSIKPTTYDTKSALPENIHCLIVKYEKKKGAIEVEFDPEDFE